MGSIEFFELDFESTVGLFAIVVELVVNSPTASALRLWHLRVPMAGVPTECVREALFEISLLVCVIIFEIVC